jgi:hypothetical protein
VRFVFLLAWCLWVWHCQSSLSFFNVTFFWDPYAFSCSPCFAQNVKQAPLPWLALQGPIAHRSYQRSSQLFHANWQQKHWPLLLQLQLTVAFGQKTLSLREMALPAIGKKFGH